jgi:hypothetical protein
MSISVKSINKNALPYNINNDIVKIKVDILDAFNPSYLDNQVVELYMIENNSDINIGSVITDEFGTGVFLFNTNLIIDNTINTTLMWAKFSYNGDVYISNKTRVNFVDDGTAVLITGWAIDAGTYTTRVTNSGDFSGYDANTPAERLTNSGDYILIDREAV